MLKKIACVAVSLAMLQGAAFAAVSSYTLITDAAFTGLGLTFKPSNNVQLMFKDEGGDAPQLYTIGAKNTSGDTIYATSNLASNIYSKKSDATIQGVKLVDIADSELPANAGESLAWDGWNAE